MGASCSSRKCPILINIISWPSALRALRVRLQCNLKGESEQEGGVRVMDSCRIGGQGQEQGVQCATAPEAIQGVAFVAACWP